VPKRPYSGQSDEAIRAFIRDGKRFAHQAKRFADQAARCFHEALELLTTDYEDKVYNFFKTYLSESKRAWAEDLTQEVFLAAHTAMPAFKEDGIIATWFWSIVRHKWIDALRRQHDAAAPEAAQEQRSPNAETAYEHKERWEVVQKHLARLPLEDRLVIALRFQGQLMAKDIAEILGIQTGSLRQKYKRALKRLQRSIREDE
jgi:RNA polymerase sigma-70 factor (ECF subfamily)